MEGRKAVVGLYKDTAEAEEALDRLTAEQFASEDVSVVMRYAPGVAGGTLGFLEELGRLAIATNEPLLAGGPIRRDLLEQAQAMNLADRLVGIGIPEAGARNYTERIHNGNVLLFVHCGSTTDVSRAEDVLKNTGGQEIAVAG